MYYSFIGSVRTVDVTKICVIDPKSAYIGALIMHFCVDNARLVFRRIELYSIFTLDSVIKSRLYVETVCNQ